MALKTIDAAAIAAAVSPARSEPGFEASILYAVREVVMSSGLIQQAWSVEPSPTWSQKK